MDTRDPGFCCARCAAECTPRPIFTATRRGFRPFPGFCCARCAAECVPGPIFTATRKGFWQISVIWRARCGAECTPRPFSAATRRGYAVWMSARSAVVVAVGNEGRRLQRRVAASLTDVPRSTANSSLWPPSGRPTSSNRRRRDLRHHFVPSCSFFRGLHVASAPHHRLPHRHCSPRLQFSSPLRPGKQILRWRSG